MNVLNLDDIEHGIRVANYSKEIAIELGLLNNQIESLYLAGALHDIGKAFVNQDILNKPGKLTLDEMRLIQRHSAYSYEECLKMGYSDEIALTVFQHHENWDSTGYPNGISGDAIHLGARILKIADVFDALTSNRCYRNKIAFDKALSIMHDEYSTFDPVLYDIFMTSLVPRWHRLYEG